MPTYNAPVEDMMFLFDKLRNNKKYNEIEKYKEVNSELVKDILDEAAASSKISFTNSELTSLYFSISLYFLLFLNLSKRNIISSTGAL